MIVNSADNPDAAYPLQPWDVITKIGDTPIDNEGYVKVGTNLRLRFAYMIQQIAKSDRLPLTVVRAGQPIALELPVSARRPMLMPGLDGAYPAYFIYGPIAFAAATQDFIAGLNSLPAMTALSASGSPLVTRRSDRPAFDGEELVIITSPFSPQTRQGLQPGRRPCGEVHQRHRRKNLRHLVELLRDAKGDHIVFDFHGKGHEILVFPRKDMVAATDEILTDNGVRSQASPELLAVWNEKPKS